jgi:hypothetical protein
MKPVYQKVMDRGLGDCFRACVASIFEFPIDWMPNFWERTQDAHEFWKMVNDWSDKKLGVKLITTTIGDGHEYLLKNLLCIAIGKTDSDEEHCVVWKNKKIHDPFPGGNRSFYPECFTLIVPTKIKGVDKCPS